MNWMSVSIPFTDLAQKAWQTGSNLSIWGHCILVHQRVKTDIMASKVCVWGEVAWASELHLPEKCWVATIREISGPKETVYLGSSPSQGQAQR